MTKIHGAEAKKIPIFSFLQMRTQNIFHTTFIPEGVNAQEQKSPQFLPMIAILPLRLTTFNISIKVFDHTKAPLGGWVAPLGVVESNFN